MNGSIHPHFYSREKGAAVVEFAVVLPILLAFLFGILEFGRVMMVNHTLNNAARAGARIAALPGADNSSVLDAINEELSGCGLSYDDCVFDPADVSTADRDDPITVTVRVNYESIGFVTGYFPMLSGKQLVGTVVMRKEGFS